MRIPLLSSVLIVFITALAPAAAANDSSAYTSQALAINGEFLRDLPAPSSGAGAICVVDTGVDYTTELDSSTVIYREALDGTDEVGDLGSSRHGTRIATIAAGAKNGWGSVGIWPAAKIVSVRATQQSAPDQFPESAYVAAIYRCMGIANDDGYDISSVNLSLGNLNSASDSQQLLVEEAVDIAHHDGFSVTAGTGNDYATSIDYPARFEGAFAVGASDTEGGGACDFSNSGDGLDLLAPGCNLDTADLDTGEPVSQYGTSLSTAIASAVLSALRSYAPELSATDAEQLLLATARSTADGPVIDAEAAFRAAGLGAYVDAYAPSGSAAGGTTGSTAGEEGSSISTAEGGSSTSTAAATNSTDQSITAVSVTSSAAIRLKRPKVISRYRTKRRLYLWLQSVPKGATLIIQVGSKTTRLKRSQIKNYRVSALLRKWRRVRLRFYTATNDGYSAWTNVQKIGVSKQL